MYVRFCFSVLDFASSCQVALSLNLFTICISSSKTVSHSILYCGFSLKQPFSDFKRVLGVCAHNKDRNTCLQLFGGVGGVGWWHLQMGPFTAKFVVG